MVERQLIPLRTIGEIFSTLVLPPLPEPVSPPWINATPLPALTLPSVSLPSNENAPFALALVAPFAPDSAGDSFVLGALENYFSCNMANYDKLPPEEKARCTPQLARRDLNVHYVLTPYEHQLQVVFAREFARKRAPLLLPCMPGGTDPKHGFLAMGPPAKADSKHDLLASGPPDNGLGQAGVPLGMISIGQIICFADGLINGFDPDTSTTYADYPYDSDVGAQ